MACSRGSSASSASSASRCEIVTTTPFSLFGVVHKTSLSLNRIVVGEGAADEKQWWARVDECGR